MTAQRHVNAAVQADPGPCPHAAVSDQLRCLDCGATLERLTRTQALATMRRRLKTQSGSGSETT